MGYCHYETPVRIEIGREFWESNNDNDSNREYIIFHELGHGILKIYDHRNDTLPNGHWKSMMMGDPNNINEHYFFYEEHRDYYVNELFLENVAIPDWAKLPEGGGGQSTGK